MFLDGFFVAVVTYYITLMSPSLAVIDVSFGTITLPLSEAVG